MTKLLNTKIQKQINQCIDLLNDVLGKQVLGIYLYGSAVVDGLQKYSDVDLFVVVDRPTSMEEKTRLIASLLQISGIYMKSEKLPIEMTIVEKSQVNPWRYPPHFDFQYGDWLRKEFENNIIEPWASKEMPDLALLITQVLLASKTLQGLDPDQLLTSVPYNDFINAITHALETLMQDINTDTRNVLLTYARIWSTLKTDSIRSKLSAADWVIAHLPEEYIPVMKRAKAICAGEVSENWEGMQSIITRCAEFMLKEINDQISIIKLTDSSHKSIKLARI